MTKAKGIEDIISKLENSVKYCQTDVMELTYIATLRLSSIKNAPEEYLDKVVDLSEKFAKKCRCIHAK